MSNVPFAAQMEELAAFFASKISVPTIGIGGGYAPIGTIISYMGTTAPQDYLACDGSTKNIADYPQLAEFFAAQFGSANFFGGNGTTTFAVPDLQGEFLRGTGTNSHTGNGSGANVGTHQDATEIPACFSYNNNSLYNSSSGETSVTYKNVDTSRGTSGRASVAGTTQANQGEMISLRPTNTSILYCIKAVVAGEVYSTEEREVGTWINGKKIYQKTVNIGSLPNNTTKSVPHGIANYDYAVSIEGFAKNSSGTVIPIPYVNQSAAGNQVRVSTTSTNIDIGTGMDFSAYTTAYVTLRYTKVSS